ncbi:MAG: arylesterase [Gammaproteobacteria bacterium]
MRPDQSLYLLCIVVLFISACAEPKLSAVPAGGTILAFGDSLTQGVGARSEESYPTVLEELSGRRVINAGISGETTTQGVTRLPGLLVQHQPDLLILIEGGNDILRNQPTKNIRANLAQMIELANEQGIQVLFLGVPEKSLFSSSAPLYKELATEYDLVFDGELIGSLLRTTSYKSDPIHFNAKGYRAMAESIYELLADNGAL